MTHSWYDLFYARHCTICDGGTSKKRHSSTVEAFRF